MVMSVMVMSVMVMVMMMMCSNYLSKLTQVCNFPKMQFVKGPFPCIVQRWKHTFWCSYLIWELMEFCKLVNRGAFEFGIGCLDFHLLSLLTFQSGRAVRFLELSRSLWLKRPLPWIFQTFRYCQSKWGRSNNPMEKNSWKKGKGKITKCTSICFKEHQTISEECLLQTI